MGTRPKILIKFDSQLTAGQTKVDHSPIVPSGQKWLIKRVIFAHADINHNISGGFQVDWNVGGADEFFSAAYLTGDTTEILYQHTITGDGIKKLRCVRQNLDTVNVKDMLIVIEGIKLL